MNKVFTILLVLFSQVSLAEGPLYHELDGSFFIWGEHLPDSEVKDLEGFSIFITGDSAKRLYEKMKAKPIYNECYNDGTITKHQGMFECNLAKSGAYSCSLGVSTKEGKVYGAESC